jgi:hypothetical protein
MPRKAGPSTSPVPASPSQVIANEPVDDDDAESEEEWDVVDILGEHPEKRLYLILWDGLDPDTGYQWEPSWESKESCSQDLIDQWKDRVKADPRIRDKQFADKKLKEWKKERSDEMARRKAKSAGEKSKNKSKRESGATKRKVENDGNDSGKHKRGRPLESECPRFSHNWTISYGLASSNLT